MRTMFLFKCEEGDFEHLMKWSLPLPRAGEEIIFDVHDRDVRAQVTLVTYNLSREEVMVCVKDTLYGGFTVAGLRAAFKHD